MAWQPSMRALAYSALGCAFLNVCVLGAFLAQTEPPLAFLLLAMLPGGAMVGLCLQIILRAATAQGRDDALRAASGTAPPAKGGA